MALVFRIVLLLLPIVALVLWLRWRSKNDLDEAAQDLELKRFRIGLGLLAAAMLLAGLGLRFTDDGSGSTDSVYIPPHVEDGKVVPGRFVPKDEVEGTRGDAHTPKS